MMQKTLLVLSGLVLSMLACEERRRGPILEEPVSSSLRTASNDALEALAAARASLASGSSLEAADSLTRAEDRLRVLSEYYVPLLEAHECAYRALRLYYLEPMQVESELSRIDRILETVAQGSGPQVEAALADAQTSLTEARTALSAGSERAPEHLEALARQISFMLIKAELILR